MTKETEMTGTTTQVIVIGGGYAGVMAANRLTQRPDLTVTLINPRPSFVERIRLHQLVGGSDDAVIEYGKVLAERVELVVDKVTEIDASARKVSLTDGGQLAYDYLVYAVGSGSADPTVPGAAQFAHPIASLEEAEQLRVALAATPATAPVTVVGGGATGIETAAELAETGREVTLVAGRILAPSLHPRGRKAIADRLTRLGVTILDGPGAKVTEVTQETVRLADDRELPTSVTIWTAGFGVPDLATRSGLTTDPVGRLLTDETLTSVDDDRIVAAGDSAAPSNLPYRMSCQAAVQLGPQAAETILARLADKAPAPAEVGFVAQCLSLGRRAGVLQLVNKDDTAKNLHMGGRTGALLKEFICKGIPWQLTKEAKKPGAHTWWTKDPARVALLAAQRTKTPASADQPA
jgi:NADH dehydrogenase